jgi:hypothetical protein
MLTASSEFVLTDDRVIETSEVNSVVLTKLILQGAKVDNSHWFWIA